MMLKYAEETASAFVEDVLADWALILARKF